MLRNSLALLRAGSLAVLLSGLVSPALAQTRAPEQIVRLGLSIDDIRTIHPHVSVAIGDIGIVNQIYEGLVAFPDGRMSTEELKPALAERWEASEDKKVWTFFLRKNVQWHGGHGEMTAADVKFSIENVIDSKGGSPFRETLSNVQAVDVVDPHAVKITLKQPDPNFLQLMANYQAGYIISMKAAQSGVDLRTNAVGTGPFRMTSYAPRESIKLAAHDAYWGGKPVISEINYQFMSDGSTRELALRSGEVHAVDIQPRQDIVNRLRKAGFTVDLTRPANAFALYLNVKKKPVDDIRVRRAMAHATNREGIVNFLGKDIAKPEVSVLSDSYVGHTEDITLYPHDVAKAKSLLKEAGFSDGLTIPVIISSLNLYLPPMQVVQEQWKSAGINLDLKVVDHPTFHRLIRTDASAIVMYGANRYPLTGRVFLEQFFASASIIGKPTAVTNFIHYGDAIPGVDDLLEAAAYNPNAQEQIRLWQQAQKKIADDVVAIPLYTQKYSMARSKSLDLGFEQESFSFYRLSEKSQLLKD